MKKYNKCFLIGITVLVLILCGMLPMITARIEDQLADDKIYYGEIKTVQLMRELNDTEKMYLLKNGSSMSVSEDKTNLKLNHMPEILETALSMYIEKGYILGSALENENGDYRTGTVNGFSLVGCEPRLYYSNEFSNLSGVFWEIQMELRDAFGQRISMCLDDQTGKVLLISYDCLEQPAYDSKAITKQVQYLLEDYQSKMDWYNEEGYYNEEHEEYYDAKIRTYRVGDVLYGEIGIQFIMTEYGFSIQIESFDAPLMQS